MLDTLFSDICRVRLRYLSVASQISVSCELDITKKKPPLLFDIILLKRY